MRALILDDSKAMRRVLARTMSTLGFTVDEATDGVQALELLEQSEDTRIVLVDLNLPEMSGLDFVKNVRAKERYEDVRLMMVTSDADQEQMVDAFAAGVDEYVTKPFTEESIRERVRILGLGEY